MARIIPELAARASAARARRTWNRRVRRVTPGQLVTVEYRSDDWQWWATGVTAAATPTFVGAPLITFIRSTWPTEGRYVLHNGLDDKFPMWDTRGLPRPHETLPRLTSAAGLYEVKVWWSDWSGDDTDRRIDYCVRGLLIDADPETGEVFIGRDTDTGTEVPLDLVLYATVTGEIPAEVIA